MDEIGQNTVGKGPGGNTKPPVSKSGKAPKANNFLLTVNEKSIPHIEDILGYLTRSVNCNYYLVAEHIGQGNKHYHIYVQYSKPIGQDTKKLHGCHIEACFGTPEQNVDYVLARDEKHKKLGINAITISQWGILRTNKATRFKTVKEVKEMKPEERLELPIQYANIVEKFNDRDKNKLSVKDIQKTVKVYYIYGPSGSGKSTLAELKIGDRHFNKVKYTGTFWQGVGDEAIAYYDDFRDSHMKASEFVNFIDYKVHNMNVKYGRELNKYTEIYITSVQAPDKIYSGLGDEPKKQWLRRMNCICMGIEEPIEEKDDVLVL